jgi:endonuclease-8
MPEGDTIHRAARTLQKAIGGRTLEAFESPLPELADRVAPGTRIDSVRARGKHLIVRFEDGRILDTHMRMDGSWHVYRPGEAWQRGAGGARVVLRTSEWIAVCFDAPWVKLLDDERSLATLGPDLLEPDVDLAQAVLRLRSANDLAIGEAIMKQRLVAGIGNVYKSETLFLCRVNPFAKVGSLDDATLLAIVAKASALMKANLHHRFRTTRRRSGGRLWVYERSGQPCFECGAILRMRRQGELPRSTYYCPRCQRTD